MKNLYYLKGLVVLLCAILLSINNLAAQSVGVHGTVKDAKGMPLPGIAVVVKGTSNGVITGANGSYTISNVPASGVLVFSSLGYVSVEEPVNSRTAIDVKIQEDNQVLDEVVVIGYGVQQKSHLTGSIAKLNTDGLADVPVVSVAQAMQGKMAGLTISNLSSEAGAEPQIRVRGLGSVNADSQPLIVVDGFPTPGGLSMVNASDIESLEVLKDAASAAIYGSRAAGGVILITTKSGKSDTPRYNVKVSTGIVNVYEKYDKYDFREYYNIRVNQVDNHINPWRAANGQTLAHTNVEDLQMEIGKMAGFPDWQNLALNPNANITKVEASVSGGNDKTKYYISGNYDYAKGVMTHSGYQKVNVRAKIDTKLSKYVELGVSLSPQYSKKEAPVSLYQNFLRYASWFPVKHTQETIDYILNNGSSLSASQQSLNVGDWAQPMDFNNIRHTTRKGETRTDSGWNSTDNTPYSIIEKATDFTNTYSMTGNSYININIMKDLTFRTSNGFFYQNLNRDAFYPFSTLRANDPATGQFYNDQYMDLLSENILNYTKGFGKHNFNAMIGYTANLIKRRQAGLQADFENDNVQTFNAATQWYIPGAKMAEMRNYGFGTQTLKETIASESYLARLMYNYDGKYLFSVSWRMDGSSKFGPDSKYGHFPSASFGWRLSEEKFMKKITWVDNLKLRLSWGITGNDNIPNYAPYNTVGKVSYPLGQGEGTIMNGFTNTSNTLGNSSLSWEQTEEINLGVDFGFLNRVNVTLDLYQSKNLKLLLTQTIPSITGFTDMWNNIGKIQNRGIEVEITSRNIIKSDFRWTTSFNLSANKNELLAFGDETENLELGERSEGYLNRVGDPFIQYYQYKTNGIWLSDAQIAQFTQGGLGSNAAAGGLRAVYRTDANGRAIQLDVADRTVCGNPFPDFTWGMTNTFSYKNFDLSFLWQGVHGVEIMNGDINYKEIVRNVKSYNFANSWLTPDNVGDGKTPSVNSSGVNWMLTDYVVEDGSYVALREATLAYNLPTKLVKKMGLNSLRVYCSGQNLLFIRPDGVRLINPEARTRPTAKYQDNPLIDGYSRGAFPMQRTITFGLDIAF